MGRSKTELFLPRVVAAAAPVFGDLIAVQRPGGETVPSMRTIFEDEHEQDGPIFGVLRALQDAAPAFVLAVDYPLLTPEVLRFLRDDGRVPVWNGRPQTLCAVWTSAHLPLLEARVAAGRRDLQGLREQEIIPEPLLRARFPGNPLMNVNTPEDLEEAESSYGG